MGKGSRISTFQSVIDKELSSLNPNSGPVPGPLFSANAIPSSRKALYRMESLALHYFHGNERKDTSLDNPTTPLWKMIAADPGYIFESYPTEFEQLQNNHQAQGIPNRVVLGILVNCYFHHLFRKQAHRLLLDDTGLFSLANVTEEEHRLLLHIMCNDFVAPSIWEIGNMRPLKDIQLDIALLLEELKCTLPGNGKEGAYIGPYVGPHPLLSWQIIATRALRIAREAHKEYQRTLTQFLRNVRPDAEIPERYNRNGIPELPQELWHEYRLSDKKPHSLTASEHFSTRCYYLRNVHDMSLTNLAVLWKQEFSNDPLDEAERAKRISDEISKLSKWLRQTNTGNLGDLRKTVQWSIFLLEKIRKDEVGLILPGVAEDEANGE